MNTWGFLGSVVKGVLNGDPLEVLEELREEAAKKPVEPGDDKAIETEAEEDQ